MAELARLRGQPRCASIDSAVRENLARSKRAAAEAWKAFTNAAMETVCGMVCDGRQSRVNFHAAAEEMAMRLSM